MLCNTLSIIGSLQIILVTILHCCPYAYTVSRLVALSVVFSLHSYSFECNSGHLLKTYYIGMLVILSLHTVLDLVIMWVSTRGTITNATPRKHMPILVYLKLEVH